MIDYGRKVTKHDPLTFGLKKRDNRPVDYDDIKNRSDQGLSTVGKLVAYKQSQI